MSVCVWVVVVDAVAAASFAVDAAATASAAVAVTNVAADQCVSE